MPMAGTWQVKAGGEKSWVTIAKIGAVELAEPSTGADPSRPTVGDKVKLSPSGNPNGCLRRGDFGDIAEVAAHRRLCMLGVDHGCDMTSGSREQGRLAR